MRTLFYELPDMEIIDFELDDALTSSAVVTTTTLPATTTTTSGGSHNVGGGTGDGTIGFDDIP